MHCCAIEPVRAAAASAWSSCSSISSSCSQSRSFRTRCWRSSRSTNLVRVTVLFLAVWWVWMYTAWTTNWLDPERLPVRICLFVLDARRLVPVGVDSALVRGAGHRLRGRVHLDAGRSHAVRSLGSPQREVTAAGANLPAHPSSGWTLSGICWIIGGFAEPVARLAWWTLALCIEFLGPWARYWAPGLGRSSVADWNVDGGHMAERCALFVIIALGEVVARHRRDVRRPDVECADTDGILQRGARQHSDVVDLLRYRRGARHSIA